MTANDQETQYLFVYGTLRDNPSNAMHGILARDSKFIGEARFRANLYDLGDYPGAVPSSNSGGVVKGEVYALSDPKRTLRLLDEYEGCRHHARTDFIRAQHEVTLEDGRPIKAWVYVYACDPAGSRIIESGDYLKFKR